MKKLMIAFGLIALTGALVAAEAKKPLTPEERAARKAKAAAEFYKQTGGRLMDTRKMKGRIVYVNAQQSADEAWLKESAAYFSAQARVKIDVEKGTFSFPDVKMVGETTIFVIEDDKMPSILAAPDQGWAAVNVTPLKAGNGVKPAFFRARVMKELTRALASAAGGIDSAFPGNPVGPIAKIEDLDHMQDSRLAVDVLKRFVKTLEARGITQFRMSTYEQACMEGWAHQPTNEVEKAIWDDIHTLPTQPITIKPESQRK